MEYTEDQLTEWFDIENVKPLDIGVYQVSDPDNDYGCYWFSFWDGDFFGYHDVDPHSAFFNRNKDTYAEVIKWRGLRCNPNAPKPKKGNKRKTMYVVAETVGPHSSHIDHKRIHAAYDSPIEAAKKSKSLRDSGLITARVFPTKRFRTPEHD